MRTFIVWFAALAPALGCAYSTPGESVFDIHPAYDGGDFSTDPGHTDPSSSVTDAGTTCHAQGSASVSGVTLAAKDAIEIFDATQAKFTFRIADYADACTLGDAVHAGSSVLELAYTGNALEIGDVRCREHARARGELHAVRRDVRRDPRERRQRERDVRPARRVRREGELRFSCSAPTT